MAHACPFCNAEDRHIVRHGRAAALWDAFPVNPGHALVVPLAHRRDLFECTPEELADMWTVIGMVKALVEKERAPAGYNIGANVGAAAGQTVFHCHVHVIPRFEGDVDTPRGGVRRVKPPLVRYDEPGK